MLAFFMKLVKSIQVVLLSLLCLTAFADTLSQRPDVQAFIDTLVTKDHFKKAELVALFNQATLNPRVIDLMNRPYEAKPWYQYRALFITPQRIKAGVAFSQKNATLLKNIQKQLQTDRKIIVATIGIETSYGQNTGGFSVFNTLVTLAFEFPKRSDFFKKELKEYLLLTREEHIDPLSLKGSYAGAMGHGQFMPSSYRAYGLRFSQDPTVNLIADLSNALASTANYYHAHGWHHQGPIAVRANIKNTKNPDAFISRYQTHYTVKELAANGITPATGHFAPSTKASLIKLQGEKAPEYWIVFDNFYVIKRYNPSDLYAMAVTQLGNSIEAADKATPALKAAQ